MLRVVGVIRRIKERLLGRMIRNSYVQFIKGLFDSSLCVDMEPADFQFTVLPLGILVFVLVAGVFYFAQREERQKKKLARVVGSYVRERRRQEKMFAEELEHLETLFLKKSINQETYVRLRELLETNIERKRQTARRSLKIPGN